MQSRTIGVFTMCDEIPARKLPSFLKRCLNPSSEENGAVHLQPNGWVACMNAHIEGLPDEVI